jgi:hypothetical protein
MGSGDQQNQSVYTEVCRAAGGQLIKRGVPYYIAIRYMIIEVHQMYKRPWVSSLLKITRPISLPNRSTE